MQSLEIPDMHMHTLQYYKLRTWSRYKIHDTFNEGTEHDSWYIFNERRRLNT